MRPERTRGAGNGDEHPLKIPIEAEGHLGDERALDDSTRIGAVRLQGGGFGRHTDGLGQCTDTQGDVDAHGRIDADLDPLPHEFLETLKLALHTVHARGEVRQNVIPRLVGHGRTADIRAYFDGGDGGARHGRAAFILDVAEQRAIGRLRPCEGRRAQDDEKCSERYRHRGD